MNLKDFEQLNRLIEDFTWYGRTYLQSGSGVEWDTVPARSYFATAWMEFFKGINDGSYHRLAEAITDAPYIPHFRKEVEERLKPLFAELDAMPVERGRQKIPVRIDVDKFGRYENTLRQMSADGIVFDIIQDDEDIRETYFIDADPALTRSYLMQGIQGTLDRYSSAEQQRIRELENRLKENETALAKKDEEISRLHERNLKLEEKLSESRREDEGSDNAVIGQASPIEDGKLRMYFFHKLGFLDKSVWNDGITYRHMATILRKVLGGKPITQDSAERYAKLFNATGNAELRDFEAKNEDKVLGYLKSVCPDMEFPKGKFINDIRKNTGKGG